MHPWILREFRMKCGDQMSALLHQHRVTFILCQNPHLRARAPDNGSPDKNRFHIALPRAFLEVRARMNVRHPAIDLPPVSVALHHHVDDPETLLRWIPHFLREKDRSGARPEHRLLTRNSISGSRSSMKFTSLSMVVLSPPGITRPSMLFRSSAVRTRTGSAPARSSAFECASKSPCSARIPTLFSRCSSHLATSPASASVLLPAASKYRGPASPSPDPRSLPEVSPDR